MVHNIRRHLSQQQPETRTNGRKVNKKFKWNQRTSAMAFGDSMEPTSHLFLYRGRNVELPVPQHHTFPLFERVSKSTKIKFKICRRYTVSKIVHRSQTLTSACSRCASCSVSNVTKPYPLLTPARSTIIFVDLTLPYDENTRHSSASVVSPLLQTIAHTGARARQSK